MELIDHLNQFWPLLFLFVFILLVRVFIGNLKQSIRYRQREALFTAAEIHFLMALTDAIGDKYRIFGKVRVADVLTPQKGMNKSNWQTAFNRIAMKHFDFVLCDNDTLEVKCVVELDDKSHLSGKAKKRDAFLNDACEGAGLRLVRVKAQREYDVGELHTLMISRDSL